MLGGMLGGRGTWTALAVGVAVLVVVPPPEPAQAATCPFAGVNVRTFTGAQDDTWQTGANWSDGNVPDSTTLVCIPDSETVDLGDGNNATTLAFWLGANATLEVDEGAGLFATSPTQDSIVETGSSLAVTSGFLGGEGTIRVRGEVSLASVTTQDTALTQSGLMVVEQSGQLSFPSKGINVRQGYQIQLDGTARLTGTGFISADRGTGMTIGATGVLDIANDTGYLEGISGGLPTLSALVNGGVVRKSAGGGTGVIDADYHETGSGSVQVLAGTLVLPTGNTNAGQVGADRTLATGRCAPRQQLDPCVVTTVPAQDRQSVSFTVPGSDASGAKVLLSEDADREFTAHAVGLATPRSDPAIITMRMGQGVAGTTNPAMLDVVHVDDRGVETVLGPCPAVGLPAGVTNCVDTAASRFSDGNVYKVVRTTETSRYICRKDDGQAPVFLKKPATRKKVALGRPIVVKAIVNEAGTITAKGTIRTKGVRVAGLTLKATVKAKPGVKTKLRLTLSRAQKQKLAKAHAQKGSITIKVVAVDKGGNKTRSKPITVTLT